MVPTTSGNMFTRSRSQKVKTVSRCMAARSLGMAAAMTCSAPPLAKSRRAICPTACGVVRSPMPISTTPLPTGWMSPPSTKAKPWSCSTSSPHQNSKSASLNSG